MFDIWDDVSRLDLFEQKRDEHRKRIGRLSFDCFNLHSKGDRAFCKLQHPISDTKEGDMHLWAVLKGTTSSVCKGCKEFNG